MKRRPATTPIDGHAQGYFTAPLAQPLTLSLKLVTSNPRLPSGCPTHMSTVAYQDNCCRSLTLLSGCFFSEENKFLLEFNSSGEEDAQNKKRHTYKGALTIALDTSSTLPSIVWKLTNTKSSSQNNYRNLRIGKITKYETYKLHLSNS